MGRGEEGGGGGGGGGEEDGEEEEEEEAGFDIKSNNPNLKGGELLGLERSPPFRAW